MHKFFVKAITTVAVCCLAISVASADRLITIPTGDTLTTGGIKAEYQTRLDPNKGRAYWLNLGISRFELEGARFQDYDGRTNDALSGQVSILPETSFTPAVAVGVRDIGDSTHDSTMPYGGRAFYLAVSQAVPVTGGVPLLLENVKFHAGVGTGSLKGVFFGAEGTIPLGLHLMAEYDSSRFNEEISYNIIPQLKVDAALIKSDVYYGASFSTQF